MSYYLHAIRHYADFRGRARRSEFWWFMFWTNVMAGVALAADTIFALPGRPMTVLVALFHIIPFTAVFVRRIHDVGRSGWLALLLLLPINPFVVLVYGCERPMRGAERFGPDPRAEADAYANGAPSGSNEPSLHARARPTPPLDQLERLASLRASGVIDDTEFQGMKDKLLGATGN